MNDFGASRESSEDPSADPDSLDPQIDFWGYPLGRGEFTFRHRGGGQAPHKTRMPLPQRPPIVWTHLQGWFGARLGSFGTHFGLSFRPREAKT